MSDFDLPEIPEDCPEELKGLLESLGKAIRGDGPSDAAVGAVVEQLEAELTRLQDLRCEFVAMIAIKTNDGLRRICGLGGSDPITLLGMIEALSERAKKGLVDKLDEGATDEAGGSHE